jgi:hypothetical protein
MASRSASVFVIASLASGVPGVSLRLSPRSPHRTRSLAQPPSTFAPETRAPNSDSGSARCAERICSTLKKGMNDLWPSPWAASVTPTFLLPKTLSTTAAGTPGCGFRRQPRCTRRTQPKPKLMLPRLSRRLIRSRFGVIIRCTPYSLCSPSRFSGFREKSLCKPHRNFRGVPSMRRRRCVRQRTFCSIASFPSLWTPMRTSGGHGRPQWKA